MEIGPIFRAMQGKVPEHWQTQPQRIAFSGRTRGRWKSEQSRRHRIHTEGSETYGRASDPITNRCYLGPVLWRPTEPKGCARILPRRYLSPWPTLPCLSRTARIAGLCSLPKALSGFRDTRGIKAFDRPTVVGSWSHRNLPTFICRGGRCQFSPALPA